MLHQLMGGMTAPPDAGVPTTAPTPPPAQTGRKRDLMLPLMALGTLFSGNPSAAMGATRGAVMAQQHRQRQAQIDQDQAMRQQQINEQMAAREEAQRIRAEAEARRRQEQLVGAVNDVRKQTFKTKADYDTYVTFIENMIGVRPNTIRGLAPYTAPDMTKPAADAVNALIKSHGLEILTSGGVVELDRDGDGIKEPVPIMEAAKIGNVPILMGPDGKPQLPPKEVKPENLQEFDVAYKGVLAEWAAEKKNISDPAIQGKAAIEARRRIATASRQATASIVMPEKPMGRYQRLTAERNLRKDAETVLAPIRDMNRQVTVMRAGLDQIQRTGRLDAGTQAIINTFNRIMEPGSVTREAEYMRTTMGQPLFESLAGQWQKLSQGGAGVRPESLNLAVELAEQIVDTLSTSADDRLDDLRAQAEDFGLPADRIVPNRESYRLKPRGGKTPGAANPMRERARKILQEGGYDTSDASIDKFIANPKNKALLGGGS
jgi:hypothetical protein